MTAVLRLKLLTSIEGPPDQQSRSLTSGALKIGREEGNDWIIDDGSRLISRHHCTITASGGLFVIIDSSANGLFINDAKQPLGRGNSAILSDGDTIHLGHVSIAAQVGEQLVTEADPFRAILPRLDSPEVPMPQRAPDPFDLPVSIPPGRRSAPSMNVPDPGWPNFELRPLPDLVQPSSKAEAVTLADHIPAEQEAILPMRVVKSEIPEDWDADLMPRPPEPVTPRAPRLPQPPSIPPSSAFDAPQAPPPPAASATPQIPDWDLDFDPAPAPPPAGAPNAVALALLEALARIEAEVVGSDESALLAGPPVEVLARIESEESEWIGLSLASLSARVIAKLKQAEVRSGGGVPETDAAPSRFGTSLPPAPESDLS
ncbi:FHA domain-containing protein [Aquabacter spiritensis]|uniref:Type VI secretion system protein ImpI n=1 Tax=Aquabacter spiritensis TaxID=933073 RepID=A0A4V2UX80_9HYPH|nr:FHA domain-containing protein [Aquabacter spiritensis]TCT02468.1 type VI secretion system protein ImpI [Aquabacter spiritensis]